MDILMILINADCTVKHSPGVKYLFMDELSHCPDTWQEQCISMALVGTAARDLIQDIEVDITDDECFGPIA